MWVARELTTAIVKRVFLPCAVSLFGIAGSSLAQYCPVGATYFASNYLGACTVGSCWASTSFAGATQVVGSYPGTYYACASVDPAPGALENEVYSYDAAGNMTSAVDAVGNFVGKSYDSLNRLVQVSRFSSSGPALLKRAYNENGVLTQVVDARGLATSYTVDGFGQVAVATSPDSGISSSSYDPAGNLISRTDARGVLATYTYDDINRVKQITYARTGATTETITFEYDGGTAGTPYAKGHLTKLVDTAGTTAWTYEAHGRVATKAQTIGTSSLLVSYGYDTGGNLGTVTLPSGNQVAFGYSNGHVSSISLNGQVLISGVGIDPFGRAAVITWANGLTSYRDHDLDGRLHTWQLNNGASQLQRFDQSVDAAGRVMAVSDSISPTNNQAYQYDDLGHLTAVTTGTPATHLLQLTYDPSGNRISSLNDGVPTNFIVDPASNRLLGRDVAPIGYLNGAHNATFTYSNANRLVGAQIDSTSVTYAVNGLGQRISKTVGTAITRFIYDERGRLIGEYDGIGNLIQETIWLDDVPLLTLRPTGSGTPVPVSAYFVHADHLGSPRLITRANDNAIVWRWDNIEPFGDSAANENPSGQGVFKYGLRLPGQYFDAETGMNYNYFRDYDSSAGRYIESDPAGLRAGPNSYIYVGAAAADHADPQGLIKWVGDLRSWGTLDVFRDELTLKSECACGLRYYATVRAVGFTLGWGSSADAWSAVELEDRLDCPNPDVFDGPYLKIGLGVAGPFGYGFGFAFLVVGGATSPGGWAAETADWDLSIGSSVGKAETISRSSDDCPCTQR